MGGSPILGLAFINQEQKLLEGRGKLLTPRQYRFDLCDDGVGQASDRLSEAVLMRNDDRGTG